MAEEVLLRVTAGDLQPITRGEVQAGDRIVRLYLSRIDDPVTPERVRVHQLVGCYDFPLPKFVLSAAATYHGLWCDRGSQPAEVRLPVEGHAPLVVSLLQLPDSDVDGVVHCQLLDLQKQYYMTVGQPPTRLQLSLPSEQQLRRHWQRQGSSTLGTDQQPLRPVTLYGLAVTYDCEQDQVLGQELPNVGTDATPD